MYLHTYGILCILGTYYLCMFTVELSALCYTTMSTRQGNAVMLLLAINPKQFPKQTTATSNVPERASASPSIRTCFVLSDTRHPLFQAPRNDHALTPTRL